MFSVTISQICCCCLVLLKVSMEDAKYADRMFNILMGDKVEPRRKFIEDNANYVRNLDI